MEAVIEKFRSNFTALLAFAALSPFSAAAMDSSSAQSEQGYTHALAPITRFDGNVRLHANNGAVEELHVVTQKWLIHGQQRIEKFPETGFMIVHLHSGKVITAIDGRETIQKGGAFWTVPDGSSMSLRVTSESALLEVTKVGPK